jgi:hypothetical protein
VQVGATWKSRGAGGSSWEAALQQIWPLQSLLWVQLFGHVAAQTPWQQMGVVADPLQSEDVEHCLGHVEKAGLRHTPLVARSGSRAGAEVQQISPFAVLQSESPEHPVGHLLAAVQMWVL